VLLVGLMGAGKTSVGRLVAERLGWRYLDNDELLREQTGRDGATLLAEQGSAALRAAEVDCLHAALLDPTPAVVGVAGGVVLDPSARAMLADGGLVVWLRAPAGLLAERIAGDATRARLGDDPKGKLLRLAAEREPHYAALADLVVEVAGRSVEQLARAVVAAVQDASPKMTGDQTPPDVTAT